MKRILAVLFTLLLLLTACTGSESLILLQEGGGDIAVIGDEAGPGHRLSQELSLWLSHWEESAQLGLGITWHAVGQTDAAGRLQAIDNSVRGGARVVVCVGAAYAGPVYEAQLRHPETMFLLLDGEPYSVENDVCESLANTYSLRFSRTQAGFLAGYAAVQEGARSLGLCGGDNSAEVLDYAAGFLQGADYAAAEMKLAPESVLLRFWCADEADVPEAGRAQLEQWEQTQLPDLLFLCTEKETAISPVVIKYAAERGIPVMTLGTTTPGVYASLGRNDLAVTQEALLALAENAGRWNPTQAGQSRLLGAQTGYTLTAAGEEWPFQQLSRAEYDALAAELESAEIPVESGGEWTPQSGQLTLPTGS